MLFVVMVFILLRIYILIFWVFLSWQFIEMSIVYSGYDFFGVIVKGYDVYYEKFVVNYGVYGWMDWLYGMGLKQRVMLKNKRN